MSFGVLDLLRIANQAGRRQRISAHDQIVVVQLLRSACPFVARAALGSIDINEFAGQVDLNTEFSIYLAEFLGDLPDAAFDKAIVATKNGT